MKLPNSIHRVLDENGIIINSNVPGEVGKRKSELQVNPRTKQEPKQEPLLPTDRQNKDKEKKQVKTNRNSSEPLYPLGTINNSE